MSVNINDINYYKITTEVTINSRSVLHPIMKKKWKYIQKILSYICKFYKRYILAICSLNQS